MIGIPFAMLLVLTLGVPYLLWIAARDTIVWLRLPRSERIRRRMAQKTAMQAFESATGNRPNWANIIQTESHRTFVRVCYGNTRPPRRAYFAVDNETLACEALENYQGDTAVWR